MTFGEKIKLERKKRKLTQAQLAGTSVTRNMISLIEQNLANPSLDTLRKIAEKLELPLSYLVSDGDDAFTYAKRDALDGIKAAFVAKNYAVTVSRIKKLEKTDDELSFILSEAYFELGRSALYSGALISAQKHFKSALEECERTVYNTERVRALSIMYLAVARNIQSPLLELDKPAFESSVTDTNDLEFFNYLIQNYDFPYKNTVFSRHLDAKRLIKTKDYITASEILGGIDATKRSGEYNAYAIFGIYSDLELCYKQLCDFENAYKYSSKRMSLLEAFKS